jgi:hypothetical protein
MDIVLHSKAFLATLTSQVMSTSKVATMAPPMHVVAQTIRKALATALGLCGESRLATILKQRVAAEP